MASGSGKCLFNKQWAMKYPWVIVCDDKRKARCKACDKYIDIGTVVTEGGNVESFNNDILDAHIVAQAITELQEIQGPVVHLQTPQIDNNGEENKEQITTTNTEPTETHVIYYIDSNGEFTGCLDKSYADSSVQANDYDIERRSGKVPARKRIIPSKFRDYKNASNDEDSDSDYEPETTTKKPRVSKPKKTKPVIKETPVIMPKSETELQLGEVVGVLYAEPSKAGRPRKNRYLKMDAGDLDRTPASIEVDRKLDEIVKNCQQEIKKREAEESQSIRKRGRGRPRGMFWKKIWICPDCGKEFNQRANLRTHLFVHTDEKPFACHIEGCDKRFRTNEGRRRHHLSHQGIKPFECDICQNKFTSQVALNEHKSRHSDEKPFQCPHCEKRFRQVSCYKRHLATHSDKQPYKCVICQRQFAQPAYLRSHMKVHTGEKPYKCETCGKQFSHQSDVKRHQTTHTGEKPYACGKCNARFTDVSSKNRHKKEHENVKRYTCHLCSETFKRQGQLRAHLDRRHNTHSFSFSLNSDKQQNNETLITLKPEENNTTNNNSVFLNQRRILDIIKNFQNKGGTEIDNIEFVSLPETNVAQTEVSSLGTDISQLEREVNASVIDGDVGVPIELHGVEVQAEDTDHTYITISNITGAWNQTDETETSSTVSFEKKNAT